MNLVGATLVISELHTKFYEQVIFGPPYLRMPNNMSSDVIAISEWANIIKPMKFLYVLRL